jgi:hypothetical protein
VVEGVEPLEARQESLVNAPSQASKAWTLNPARQADGSGTRRPMLRNDTECYARTPQYAPTQPHCWPHVRRTLLKAVCPYSPNVLKRLSDKGTSNAPIVDLAGIRRAKWTEKPRFCYPQG